jgi:hypothetical protein
MLGVSLGLFSSTAMAQTGPPLNWFDFEEGPPDDEYDLPPPDEEFSPPPIVRKKRNTAPAVGRTMFDLFPPERKRPTSAVTRKEPRTQSKRAASEVPTIANEKKRLRALAVRLERQRQAQEAEARRLRAEALALNGGRKSRGEVTQGVSPSVPSTTGPEADEGNPSGVSVREKLVRRTDKTYVARAESGQPLSTNAAKPGPQSIKCKRAKSIIEGFAFSDVEPKACDGETYLFSATRDNNPFSIKINSQTWELTEVSKLK